MNRRFFFRLLSVSLFVTLFIILGGFLLSLLYPQVVYTPLSSLKSPETQKPVDITLWAVGDVGLGRSVNAQMVQLGESSFPFKKVEKELKTADILLMNLEGPFVSSCPVTVTGVRFCSEAKHIEALLFSGVDVVTLANNHMSDYGQEGIEETVRLLTKYKIAYTGLHNVAYKNIRGTTFAFIGFTDIPVNSSRVSRAEEVEIKNLLARAKKNADVMIVTFHWGKEYTATPTERQTQLAHTAIDLGADVVIGHHPHWVQSVEVYKNGLIFYSLGNFVFDQMWSQETREGVIAKIVFRDTQPVSYMFSPIFIGQFGQPRFLGESESTGVFDKLFP